MRQKLLKNHSNGHQLSKVFMRGHFKLIPFNKTLCSIFDSSHSFLYIQIIIIFYSLSNRKIVIVLMIVLDTNTSD